MPVAHDPPGVHRYLRFLAAVGGFIAIVLTIVCLYWGSTVLIPVALALLLTFLLAPVVSWLERKSLRRVPAVLLVVAIAGTGLVAVGWVVVAQVTALARQLRDDVEYKENIKQKINDLRGLGKGGILDDLQATIDEVTGQMGQGPKAKEIAEKSPVVVQTKQASPAARIWATAEPLLEPLASAGLVIVLVIFMLLKYEDLRSRLVGLFGEGQLILTTKALADAGGRISRYLLMQLIVNGTYGLAVGLGLFIINVPYSPLWGFLAAVLRYVPYVGPWIAALFPLAISLVAFKAWWPLFVVLGLILVCELVSNLVMEPLLYGQSIGVSEVALLVATGFWTWLWGPIGLVLATPLTVCLIVLGRHVPAFRLVGVLMGDTPGLGAPAAYYQRLLANDTEEASRLAVDYGRLHGSDKVYDDVLIPAILLARQDRKQGTLSREDEAFIFRAILAVTAGTNPEAQEAAGAGQPLGGQVPPRPALGLVVACPARQEAEELILQMLQRLMQPAGLEVEAIPRKTLPSDVVRRVRERNPAVVFVAVLPGGLPQARYLCKHLRKEFPQGQILVGYWGKGENFDKVLVRLRRAGAGYLTTSLLQTRARIVALAQSVRRGPAAEKKAENTAANE